MADSIINGGGPTPRANRMTGLQKSAHIKWTEYPGRKGGFYTDWLRYFDESLFISTNGFSQMPRIAYGGLKITSENINRANWGTG